MIYFAQFSVEAGHHEREWRSAPDDVSRLPFIDCGKRGRSCQITYITTISTNQVGYPVDIGQRLAIGDRHRSRQQS
jgi:hypothetical protein